MKLRFALLLVTVSGFISLSYELLWYRVYSFSVAGAAYAFALLLWAYLTGIAVGSYIARDFCADNRSRHPGQLRTLAAFIVAANLGGFLSIPLMAVQQSAGLHPGLSLLSIIIVAGALGAQLPLICHYGIQPGPSAGEHVSYLYVGNIVGSVAGSLLTGFVLFDVWPLETIVSALTILGISVALALYAMGRPDKRRLVAASVATLIACAAIVASAGPLYHHLWERLQLQEEYDASRSFKHVVQNKSGVITVDQDDKVYGGGVYDGQFSVDLMDDTNLIVRPLSVGLFHPEPKKVLVVGLASGTWATVVANHPDVEQMTIVEINPGYIELIEQYEPNRKLLDDPRIDIVIDDGRRWLNRNPDRKFDAIVANTTFNWRAQASNLLSREWVELIGRHLRPGGIYLFNPTSSGRAVKSAMMTLPYCVRIINNAVCSKEPIDPDPLRWRRELMVWDIWGEPLLNPERPEHRERVDEIITKLADLAGPDDPMELYQFEGSESVRERIEHARPITDDNMGTEWSGFLEDEAQK
jgi:predicted membrane-bound spermidine synthase